MDEQTIKRRLSDLDFDDRRILYWKCHGLNNEQIANRLAIEGVSSHSAIHNRLIWIQGLLRTKDTLNKDSPICVLYYDAVGYPPPSFDDENWPPPDLQVDAVTPPFEPSPENTAIPPTAVDQNRSGNRLRIGGPAAVLLLVLLLIFAVFLLDQLDIIKLPFDSPADIGVNETAEIETEEPIAVVSTDEPATDMATGQSAQVTAPTAPAEPTPVPVPTDTPTPTFTPSVTPSPTDTPAPTATHTPTATPAPVLNSGEVFFEDFSDGINEDEWERIQGNWDIFDNKMVAAESMQLIFGEMSSASYEITIKVVVAPGHQDGNFVCVRCTASDGVYLEFGGGPWSGSRAPEILVVENNNPPRRLKFYYSGSNDKIITITVIDNNFNAFMGNNELITYQMRNQYGKLSLTINKGTSLEWIRVERLD